MLQVTAHMRVMVAVEPVDFRCGIDGLVGRCRSVLREQPMSGTMFVFSNKRRNAIKILVYDGQGFWLCQKRWSEGRFRWWPGAGTPGVSLQAHELQVLLRGGDPSAAKGMPDWKPVKGKQG